MKKPIIFLSVFLFLYVLNLLVLPHTMGISLLPSSDKHSKNTMPLMAKSSSTFNPIPLSLIKDPSTPPPPSAYVKSKPDVVIKEKKIEEAKAEEKPVTKKPLQPLDVTKNTNDFAPNPPADVKPAAAVQQQSPVTETISYPAQMPSEEEQVPPAVAAPEPKPQPVKEEVKPVKTEPKVKTAPKKNVSKSYPELVDQTAEQKSKETAFVSIETKKKEAVKTRATPKAEPAVKKEAPKQDVKPAPVMPAQTATVTPPAPQKPAAPKADNSAKLADAGLIDVEDLPIKIFLDIRYATTNNFTGKKLYSTPKCYLNKTVAQAFVKAVFYAQEEGMYFCIYDCYRPSSVQQLMWDKEDNGKFLSSPGKGSNHSRGGAVDLGPCDSSGKPLPAPTGFDSFTDAAASNAKDGIPADALENRTTLQNVMKKAGFSTIRNEWWHFDYKDAKDYPLLDIPF